MTLSEELQRIADDAPVVPVDPDTWARAWTARRRDRGLMILAAAAVVGVILTATFSLPGSDATPRPVASPAPTVSGLPGHIDYVSGPGEALVVGANAVGAAVAAYVNDDGAAVLVGVDGEDHLLALPGLAGPIALSRDGTRLAFGSVVDGLGQINTVDLRRGELTSTSTRRLVSFESFVWSESGDVFATGRADDGSTRTELLRDGARVTNGVAVADGTRVAVTADSVPVAVDDTTVSMLDVSNDAEPVDTVASAAHAPVVGVCASGFTAVALRGSSTAGWAAWAYDVRTGRLIEGQRATPPAVDGLDLEVVSCLKGPDPLLADRLLVRSGDDLAVLTVGDVTAYDVVARVDNDVADLSVATALVEE